MTKLSAVSDSGPIMHLSEIGALKILGMFNIVIPEEVLSETANIHTNAKVLRLDQKHKDLARLLTLTDSIQLGEAEAISLALQQGVRLFFTDDLDARSVAGKYGLKAHGTVGILVKAFRKGILSESEVVSFLRLLRSKSSLFITNELVEWCIRKIRQHSSSKKRRK